jgi:biopolymer transport protein ExbD
VPEVAQAGDNTSPPEPLVVAVQSDGRLELNGTRVSLDELTARLAALRKELGQPTVIIRGDGQCAFQHVAAALAACRQAGVSDLGITVRIAGIGQTKR